MNDLAAVLSRVHALAYEAEARTGAWRRELYAQASVALEEALPLVRGEDFVKMRATLVEMRRRAGLRVTESAAST